MDVTKDSTQTPSRLMLSPGPLEGGWQVVMPLPVDVEVDETGYVVVSDAVFAVYGDGSSFEAAWRDYRTSLAEYCAMVRADATRGPEDEREYQRLLTYIQPCVGTR